MDNSENLATQGTQDDEKHQTPRQKSTLLGTCCPLLHRQYTYIVGRYNTYLEELQKQVERHSLNTIMLYSNDTVRQSMVNKALPLLVNDATLLLNTCKTCTILPIIHSILLINAEKTFTEHCQNKRIIHKNSSKLLLWYLVKTYQLLRKFLIRYKRILPD